MFYGHINSYFTLTRRHIFWTTNSNSVHSELQLGFDIHASLISWDQWELRGRSFLPINCARSAFYSGIESKRMRNKLIHAGQGRQGKQGGGGNCPLANKLDRWAKNARGQHIKSTQENARARRFIAASNQSGCETSWDLPQQGKPGSYAGGGGIIYCQIS